MRIPTLAIALLAMALSLPFTPSTHAQTASFQVDPTASSLTVSGTALGAPIQQQGPGSLTTTYFGPLFAQLSPGAISFPGGSEVTANDSGNWQPAPGGKAGSAPANYGGRVTILFVTSLAAVREAIFDVTTMEPFALGGSGNTRTFSSALDVTSVSGTIDYASPLAGNGSDTIAGNTGTNAATSPSTLNIAPGTAGFADATLASPVSFTIITDIKDLGEGVFHFNGNITARASARGGDANFDGRVDLNDFNTLAANFGTTSGAGWLQGDFTFDGSVSLDDFNVLAGNFGMAASANGPTPADWSALASAVPEPSGSVALALAFLLALHRRRRSINGAPTGG